MEGVTSSFLLMQVPVLARWSPGTEVLNLCLGVRVPQPAPDKLVIVAWCNVLLHLLNEPQ